MAAFADRAEAGRRLAGALSAYAPARPIVFALPRGGAPVAAEIARALGAPLDLTIARKIGAPGNPELAMGAIAEGDPPVVTRNEDVIRAFCVGAAAFAAAQARAAEEIARRGALWRGGAPALSPQGRVAILVDDGIATGATAAAAAGQPRGSARPNTTPSQRGAASPHGKRRPARPRAASSHSASVGRRLP